MFLGMTQDKDYFVSLMNGFIPEYFDSHIMSETFGFLTNYFKEYKELPTESIILSSTKYKEETKEFIDRAKELDFDLSRTRDWLLEESNKYLKDKAIKKAIIDSVDIIDKQEDSSVIRKLVEDALCRDMKADIGVKYWRDMGPRLIRMFSATDNRIPTYFPMLDEFTNGGFPPRTLSVLMARIHGFKSGTMANIIARQVMHGKNIALATLEMDEDMFCQRFDGIFSGLDINRMYLNKNVRKNLTKKLTSLRGIEGRGEIFVKAWPPGKATVNDFRIWLRELKMRGINIDALYFDYINLLKPEGSKKGLYEDVKGIAEDARALGFEFEIPCISVSQLNREGMSISFDEVDFNYISESIGVPATADFCMIMGRDPDRMTYNSELWYKIVKNRLGGRVGEVDHFFVDNRSLKMYCSSELDLWMKEAAESGDSRNLFEGNVDTRPRRRSNGGE